MKTDSENQFRCLEIQYQNDKEIWAYEEKEKSIQAIELERQISELQF